MARKRTAVPQGTDSPPPGTLERLLGDLSPGVLRLMAAPQGLGLPVTDAVIHDPFCPPDIEAGDVVLAVGTQAGRPEASSLVREAGTRGAAAVVFKVYEQAPPELVEAAGSSGVALLGAPPELAWGHLHSLLRTALVSASSVIEQHPAGVPVGDLFALANAIAGIVGGPVAIGDPRFGLLAYSTLGQEIDETRLQSILGRRATDSWVRRIQEDGTLKELWATSEVVRVDQFQDEGLRRRLAIAVRAGEQVLGSIWVAEESTPLGSAAEAALKEAASIAALHLIRHRAKDDLERRMRGELLHSVLEGREPADLVAGRLGIEAECPVAVMAFELQSDDESEIAVKQEPVLDLVSLRMQSFRRRSVCASVGRIIYALLPMSEPTKGERLLALASEVMTKAEATLRMSLHAGIGSVVGSVRDAPQSRWEADQVLRILVTDWPSRHVAHFDDVRARVILQELTDVAKERTHLRSEKLERLVRHDARHGTSYIATLKAYLDSFGNIQAAASLVCVHPNTFRYRLGRLLEVSKLNLEDPDERLVTELQIRLLPDS